MAQHCRVAPKCHAAHAQVPRRVSQAKCLPLHLAAANNYIREDKVVRLLLNAHPEGAQAIDLGRAFRVLRPPARPPAHAAGSHPARASARAEWEARGSRRTNPASHPRRSSQCKSLPLHTAAMNDAPAKVVWLLLRAYPDGAIAKDKVTAPRVASPPHSTAHPPPLLASAQHALTSHVACADCRA